MRRGASSALKATRSSGHLCLLPWRNCLLAHPSAGAVPAADVTSHNATPPFPVPYSGRLLSPAAPLPSTRLWSSYAHAPTGAARTRARAIAAAAAATGSGSPPPCGAESDPTAHSFAPPAQPTTSGPDDETSSSRSTASASTAPQLPLCRRPAVHVDELGAALAWRDQMAARIAVLGDSLELQDGGPDREGLMRELDWVLDDVIEAVRLRPDNPWEETSWRLLEPRVRAAEYRGADPRVTWQLRLREPVSQLWGWWERRLQERVPFQYLIRAAHWHRYVLSVGPGVLVPRPETEIFAELVQVAVSERPYLAAAPWADLGTGSGAVAIAAADELRRVNPVAEVWAVDLSPVAVAYARFNSEMCLAVRTSSLPSPAPTPPASSAHNAASEPTTSPSGGSGGSPLVRVVQGSWFEPIRHLRGRLGGVLSNPPYIPREEMAELQAEVGRHEPWGALDGGEGPGLDSLQGRGRRRHLEIQRSGQALCSEAAAMLAPGGLIALETAGGAQAELVADMLRAAPAGPAEGGLGPVVEEREGTAGRRERGGDGGAPAEVTHGSLVAAFEHVEVLEDCYGVRRFVRAYRRGGQLL